MVQDIQDFLDKILTEEQGEAGLYLERDRDFVYLKYRGRTLPLRTWHWRKVTYDQVREEANHYQDCQDLDNKLLNVH